MVTGYLMVTEILTLEVKQRETYGVIGSMEVIWRKKSSIAK